MRWDGSQWTLVDVPSAGTETRLLVVNVISPTAVWVGGYVFDLSIARLTQLLLYWDGASWTNTFPDVLGMIAGIGVISPTDIWASVPYYYPGLSEAYFPHFDGSQWTNVSSQNQNPGEIEPISSNDIWSIVADPVDPGRAMLYWNGISWHRVSLPSPENRITSLAAISSNDVWAVGSTLGSATRMLALHYNPSCVPTPIPTATVTRTPTITPTPQPPPCPGERFTDVCPDQYFYTPVLALADDGIDTLVAEHARELRILGELGGDEAGERHGVEVADAARGGDQLTGAVHEVDRDRARARDEVVERLIDDPKIILEQSPLRHRPLPGYSPLCLETPGTSMYRVHSYHADADRASADFP